MKKVLLFLLFMPVFVIAQTEERGPGSQAAWIDGGVGVTTLQIGSQLGLNVQMKNAMLVSYDFDIATQVNRDGGIPWTDAYSHAVSVGMVTKKRFSLTHYSAGISLIRGRHGEQDFLEDNGSYTSLGFRTEVGTYFSPGVIGLGVSLYVNLSKQVQYGGLTVNVGLGHMRKGRR